MPQKRQRCPVPSFGTGFFSFPPLRWIADEAIVKDIVRRKKEAENLGSIISEKEIEHRESVKEQNRLRILFPPTKGEDAQNKENQC